MKFIGLESKDWHANCIDKLSMLTRRHKQMYINISIHISKLKNQASKLIGKGIKSCHLAQKCKI